MMSTSALCEIEASRCNPGWFLPPKAHTELVMHQALLSTPPFPYKLDFNVSFPLVGFVLGHDQLGRYFLKLVQQSRVCDPCDASVHSLTASYVSHQSSNDRIRVEIDLHISFLEHLSKFRTYI